MPRARHQDRRRAFGSRRRGEVRASGRRVGVHRAAAIGAKLPEHSGDHQRRRSHRRAGDPSGLRLPVRKRRLRREGREERIRLHRAAPRHHPADGRQGQRQGGDDQGGRALRAGFRRGAARRREGDRQDRARGQVSGDHQGRRRRRRPRHARRAYRGGAVVRGEPDARGSGRGVRQSRRCTWKSTSRSRGTSKSRCSPTSTRTPSTCSSATARCSAGTRRSSRKRRRPASRRAR